MDIIDQILGGNRAKRFVNSQRPGYVTTKQTVILPETTAEFYLGGYFSEDCPELALVVGQTYKVLWDGKTYACVAHELVHDELPAPAIVLGNEEIETQEWSGDGEPFAICYVDIYGMRRILTAVTTIAENDPETTTHTFAIYQDTEIIDPKFLPKGGVGYTEGSAKTLTWDGDTTNEVDFGGLSGVKIADYTDLTKVESVTVKPMGLEAITMQKSDFTVNVENPVGDVTLAVLTADDFVFFLAISADIEGIEAGTYAISSEGIVKSISANIPEIIHTIDDKYLSGSVAKVNTASVGQTVVVKAVDENGKPTEWEAVDMPGVCLPVVELSGCAPGEAITDATVIAALDNCYASAPAIIAKIANEEATAMFSVCGKIITSGDSGFIGILPGLSVTLINSSGNWVFNLPNG